jgi:hypothetical protein
LSEVRWAGIRTIYLVMKRPKSVVPWDVYVGNIFLGPCTDPEADHIMRGVYPPKVEKPDTHPRPVT